MKKFVLYIIFSICPEINAIANVHYNDTVIVYKILPRFFFTDYNRKNVFSQRGFYKETFDSEIIKLFKNGGFCSRDKLLLQVDKNLEIRSLLRNFFALEDEYLKLNRVNQSTLYFYIYLAEDYYFESISRDSTVKCEVSYLDVEDYICTYSKRNALENTIIKAIRTSKLTQNAYIPPFNLVFESPKKLEYYYRYYPTVDEAYEYENKQDYHISNGDFEALLSSNGRLETALPKSIPNEIGSTNRNISGEIFESSDTVIVVDDKKKSALKNKYRNGDENIDIAGTGGPGGNDGRYLSQISKDSLDILAEKTNEIIQTYKYFVKQFLTGKIMLRALPDSLTFSDGLTYHTLENLPNHIKESAREYIDFDKKCRIFKAVLNNRSINVDTTLKGGWIGGAQSGYNKLFKDVNSIKIIYVNKTLILNSPWALSFRELKSKNQHFKDSVMQDVLYSRNSLLDDINSINYTDPDLKHFQLPILLKQMNAGVIRENFALLDSILKPKIAEIKTSYDFFNSSKLWVQTDVNNQVIYISPFLIRAAFTTALEKFDLFSLAYNQDNLKDFFWTKGRHISAEAINNIYNERVYTDYTNTIKFVTAHEIAHIYLKNVNARNKESLCDCYAIYHLKKEGKEIETGVFETLLVKSINENALRFWGEGTNSDDIIKRYSFIKTYKRKDEPLSLSICDTQFK